MSKALPLTPRQQALIALAAEQRTQLQQHLVPLKAPLAVVDRGVAAVRYVQRNPHWLLAGLLVVAAFKPRWTGRKLMQAWSAWQVVGRFRPRL